MTTAQQALQGNIERGFTAVDAAQNDLLTQAELPPLGTDPVSQPTERWAWYTHIWLSVKQNPSKSDKKP